MTNYGWHFLANDRRLRWNDNQPLEVGSVLHVEPPLEMCRHGLHWSKRPTDALKYALGSTICYVETYGKTLHGVDKSVSEYRHILWMYDAERLLWQWLCDIAEIGLGDTEAKESRAAIKLRRSYLSGNEVKKNEWIQVGSAARRAASSSLWSPVWLAMHFAIWAAAYEWYGSKPASVLEAAGSAAISAKGLCIDSMINDQLTLLLISQMRQDKIELRQGSNEDHLHQ